MQTLCLNGTSRKRCYSNVVFSVDGSLVLVLSSVWFFDFSSTDDSRRVSVRDLFAALQEPEIDRLQQLAASVQTFNRRESLKRTETYDRSAPYIDHHVAHLLAIHNYNHDDLNHVTTRVTQHVVVGDDTSSVCDTERRSKAEAKKMPSDETTRATNKSEHYRDR